METQRERMGMVEMVESIIREMDGPEAVPVQEEARFVAFTTGMVVDMMAQEMAFLEALEELAQGMPAQEPDLETGAGGYRVTVTRLVCGICGKPKCPCGRDVTVVLPA